MSTCSECQRSLRSCLHPSDWHKYCALSGSVECRAVATVRAESFNDGVRAAMRVANAQATIDWSSLRETTSHHTTNT